MMGGLCLFLDSSFGQRLHFFSFFFFDFRVYQVVEEAVLDIGDGASSDTFSGSALQDRASPQHPVSHRPGALEYIICCLFVLLCFFLICASLIGLFVTFRRNAEGIIFVLAVVFCPMAA